MGRRSTCLRGGWYTTTSALIIMSFQLLLAACWIPTAISSSSSSSTFAVDVQGQAEQQREQHHQQQEQQEHHRRVQDSQQQAIPVKAAGQTLFVESHNTAYEADQQAWRMLGFFVDCQESQQNDKAKCARYLLWAAYVDKNYQGGGVGEYSYWNPSTGTYDESACQATGNSRCAKMDCHEDVSETWELLGVFKEYYYSTQWFEQLFKHEGVCLWDDDTYKFMQTYAYYWPESCTQAKATDENGNALYMDLKPIPDANMTAALYTDEDCSKEYTGNFTNITISGAAGDKILYGDNLATWNKGMEVYKQCQPCRAYSLSYNGYSCYDAAGYTNVNQCMKFASKTNLEVANFKDLKLAQLQGGLLSLTVGDKTYGLPKSSWASALTSSTVGSQSVSAAATSEMASPPSLPWLVLGGCSVLVGLLALMVACVWRIRRRRRLRAVADFSEPLMTTNTTGLMT